MTEEAMGKMKLANLTRKKIIRMTVEGFHIHELWMKFQAGRIKAHKQTEKGMGGPKWHLRWCNYYANIHRMLKSHQG
jgi:hypothetical protein